MRKITVQCELNSASGSDSASLARTFSLYRFMTKYRGFLAIVTLILAIACSANGLAAAKTNAVELFPDPVVAKGKGFEIRQSELDDAVANLRATLATQNQPIPDRDRNAVAARLLDRMVITRILLQKATEEDLKKAKTAVDKFLADTKAKAPSEESYRRQLRATGMTPELFEKRAAEQAIVETVVERELKSTISVSEDEVRDFYEHGMDQQAREVKAVVDRLAKEGPETVFYADGKKKLEEITKANLARLERPEQVRANIIALYTIDRVTKQELSEPDREAKRALAERIVARLKAGESWSDLASEYSDDLDAKRNRGEYVIVRTAPASPELADLKAMLFQLPVNEISGPITNKLGFYIVRVLEHTPAGKMPYDKAAPEIREFLINQELQKRLPEYTEKLKKEYNVEINLPR
jgi:peptidyl-prolyl cis-trans isomerase D